MNNSMKIAIVVALSVAVVAVIVAKHDDNPTLETSTPSDTATDPNLPLPRLVELGSDTCIPCKAMMPVLAELRADYTGALSVEFYDVKKEPALGEEYKISLIPTQIFFDASGKELYRHEGFFAKEDILAKWKELGVNLSMANITSTSSESIDPNI